MKFNSNIFLIAGMAVALVGCKDDLDPNIPVEKGSEVVFRAVSDEATRTAYGPLGETSRPVYWVNGDDVTVGSPQCLAGRNIAQYRVNAGTTTQNYATSLDKTGDYGVQWGSDAADAKFFAVYPATADNNNMKFDANGNATATMTIAAEQEIPIQAVTANGTTSYSPNLSQWQTKDNVMYAQPIAKQSQITTADGVTTANLKFKPYSTALHFTLAGWEYDTSSGEIGQDNLVIYSATLSAPAGSTTYLAGTFDLQLKADGSTPTIGNVTNGSTSVTSEFVTRSSEGSTQSRGIEMNPDSPLEFDMFVCPTSGVTITKDWTIAIFTSAGIYSRSLEIVNAPASLELKPGLIHKLPTLPKLSTKTTWNYEPTSWMADLSDNTYFTELTLPGSWYSANNTADLNKDTGYQASTSILNQWKLGIRAFYFETRVGYTGMASLNARYSERLDSRNNSATLVMSGGGSNQKAYGQTNGYYDAGEASTYIEEVAKAVNNGEKSECAVLTLSYSDGGEAGVSGFWRVVWLDKISKVITALKNNANSNFSKVYYEKEITPNTTLKDVRGKLIIKINIDSESEIGNATWSYSNNNYSGTASWTPINALFSYTNYSWAQSTENTSLISDLTWISAPKLPLAGATINDTGFFCNYTIANRTNQSTAPTYANRKALIETIIKESISNRNREIHNVLFMIGAGGSYFASGSDNGSPSDVAANLNPYLSNLISDKIKNGQPSPLGLVYFNLVGADAGKTLIDQIIRLNKRYDPAEAGNTQQPIEAVTAKEGFGSGFKVSANGYKVF